MSNKWVIDKQFDTCYGHRVFTQTLNTEFTEKGHTCAACRHIHGHQGKIHIFLESDTLNPNGMVEDFVHLGWFKNFIDDTIDHKFIVSCEDPMFERIVGGTISGQMELNNGIPTGKFVTMDQLNLPRANGTTRQLPLLPITVKGSSAILGYKIDTSVSCVLGKDDVFVDSSDKEIYDSFVIVNFVPTSENLCKWLFDIAQEKMSKLGVKVSRLDFFETPKSRSSYRAK